MLIMRMRSVRMSLMLPSRGRERLLIPEFKAMLNAVQMPPKRGPQQGPH